jgi:hypothetical protein
MSTIPPESILQRLDDMEQRLSKIESGGKLGAAFPATMPRIIDQMKTFA